ncbi:PREDICTED: alpha-1,4-N-acetylglucosaminyltransferase-like [Nanorana parkeri]|uniref:alpha-1,4-N-acetylglucosaminyltransferase-like n=1 Tax=Nanorana parkeri TaxID=125878 RepID=UPI000853FE3D|nr:PREDICTED: alpha-1,4-N-acetylglucosaminyltransferase-like [Nanorana parkeri]
MPQKIKWWEGRKLIRVTDDKVKKRCSSRRKRYICLDTDPVQSPAKREQKKNKSLGSITMLKQIKILTFVMAIAAITFLSRIALNQKSNFIMNILTSNGLLSDPKTTEKAGGMSNMIEKVSSAAFTNTILRQGNGIFFVETTGRMEPPSLVLCAIESAARVYPDRPVVFFMKGLGDIMTAEEDSRTREHFPTLYSFHNIYIFPLRMNELFNQTPLMTWFKKVNPEKERYWTHVSADACRLALIWKYGGIYMDCDFISIRPIPNNLFLAPEHAASISNGVFGLSQFHPLTWLLLEDFADNYKGEIWGQQGPRLFTRVVKKWCGLPVFITKDDVMCGNISYCHPQRFYPISYPSWRKYYEVWKDLPTFNGTYALHLWNFMNKEGKTMVPGSNTLVEHLYQKQCPSNYDYIMKKQKNSSVTRST